MIKLNLGSGLDYREGYVNVDKYAPDADLQLDLEVFPWPWEDNSVDTVLLRHVLEHLGQSTECYLNIIKELYRVCAPGATVTIEVPHPQHPDYFGDPTHCRPVTAESLWLFNRGRADEIISLRATATPLAAYLNVDFVMTEHFAYEDKQLGIVQASQFVLKVRKPIKVAFMGNGVGDMCMGLGTAHALSDAGYRVTLVAPPQHHILAEACPHVYDVTENREGEVWICAWNQLQARHQVDECIAFCGVPLSEVSNHSKSIDIEIPKEIRDEMASLYPGRDRIIIHPALSTISRGWPKEYWQDLASRLISQGYEVVSTGMTIAPWVNNTYILDGVLEAFNLPILHNIALYNQAKLLISNDSGPIQLAGATDCGILGLYSVMAPEYRLPYRHGELGWNAHGILTPCPHASCYNEMVYATYPDWSDAAKVQMNAGVSLSDIIYNWCSNKEAPYSCMKSIGVDEVFIKAVEMYNR